MAQALRPGAGCGAFSTRCGDGTNGRANGGTCDF
jgi:hypothetical protein